MKNNQHTRVSRATRFATFALLAAAFVAGTAFWGAPDASANHPVLVEGNCDSPIPGTTSVPVVPGTGGSTSGGICGDWDGDGRIGTAEDTDGADRIFGTLNAALGPGTGAAAGTGANHNGTIIIVKSGRFAETLYIGQNLLGPTAPGVANPGNVTIEAAPGVQAEIDAVLQGDPAGANPARQNSVGIQIVYTETDHVVTLRNLVIRNFTIGIGVNVNSRVNIDNCRIENNLAQNIQLADTTRTVITNTQSLAAGRRVGGPSAVPSPGNGLLVRDSAQVRIMDSVFSHNAAAGIINATSSINNIVLFRVGLFFNNPDISGEGFGAVIAPNPNWSN